MGDGLTLFAIKLGRAVGRHDFDVMWGELNLWQQSMHIAAALIEPFGEDRADLREAHLTLHLMQAISHKAFTDEEASEIQGNLQRYLRIHGEAKKAAPSPEEAARQGKAAFAKIGL